MKRDKIVLIYGTFDRIHPGHESFIRQAKALGDKLIAAVAHDDLVKKVKHKTPTKPQRQRMDDVRALAEIDQVVACGPVVGQFNSVTEVRPDIVALGYDQEQLGNMLRKWLADRDMEIKVIVLKPFYPDKYKSSILNQ